VIRPLLAALALLAATEAAALTCRPADPLRSFREAQAAPETYHVLHGQLAFDAAEMPQGLRRDLPLPVAARFTGFALGRSGFTTPIEAGVTLQPICAGPYCGTFGPGEALLFAQVTDNGYLVEIGPCGDGAFDRVTPALLEDLAACLRGEACGAP
jgi:hypothetical protein